MAGDEGISVMKEDPTSAVYIPHRVKEIGTYIVHVFVHYTEYIHVHRIIIMYVHVYNTLAIEKGKQKKRKKH